MADKREIFAIGKIVVSIAILIRLMWYKLLRVQPIASQANVHLVIASDGWKKKPTANILRVWAFDKNKQQIC